MVVPISLRPKHDQVEPCSLECNPVAGTVLLVLEYMDGGYVVNRVYILVVLRTKKELRVLECMDKDKNSCRYAYDLRTRQPLH